MPKPPLHDVIVKPARRSIPQDVGAPRSRSASIELDDHQARPSERPPVYNRPPEYTRAPEYTRNDVQHNSYAEATSPFEPRHDHDRNFPWLLVALGIGGVIVVLSFVLSILFAGATVTVYPKQETVSVTTELNATLSTGILPFERMSLERSTETTLVAMREEKVEERATGRITIFNEYSETPQRLIKNTRFESPDGLIYRIRESVEVPGKKTNGTAGTIDIAVFAEEPGESYNKASADFTIPGFEGLPQEGKVYAKTVGSIEGGFDGVRRTIDDTERETALRGMETKLRDELLAAAFGDSARPEGFVLYKDAIFFDFQPSADRYEGDDKVVLSLTGTLHGIMLKEDALAQGIARATIAGYTGEPVRIDNPDDLIVRVSPKAASNVEDAEDAIGASVDSAQPWTADTMGAAVSGKARLVWLYDEVQLAQDLAGMNKETMYVTGNEGILARYPGIDRAEASVRPFWKKSFPEAAEDVTVVTVLDSQ